MDNDQIQDLKQFITATVSQTEQRLGELMDNLENKVEDMRQEMQEGFAGVGDAISGANDQLEDHEQRITKLESAQS